MGILVRTKLQCDCKKSLETGADMEKIIERISGNKVETVFQCKHCNRSIKSIVSLTYIDYNKGIRTE